MLLISFSSAVFCGCGDKYAEDGTAKSIMADSAASADDLTDVSTDAVSDPSVKVHAEKTNSWEDDKAAYSQYTLSITNESDSDITGWSADISVPEKTELSQSWNCSAECKGGRLSLKNVDYNSKIASGSEYHDTGLIIMCSDEIPDVLKESTFSYNIGGKEDRCAITTESSSSKDTSYSDKDSIEADAAKTDETAGKADINEKADTVKGEKDNMDSDDKVTALHVDGTDLKNAKGDKIQLKGISSHAMALYPQYINEKSIKTFRDDWHANVFRLAMYTMEDGGYCNGGDQKKLEALIDTAVSACKKLDMYVIIDWHILSDGNPLTHEKESEAFFEKMSKKYAGIPNVIYEICNEPNNSDWKTQIKPYAEDIIPIIRKNDKNALILVGTNTWSQDVDEVSSDPLEYDNIMYSVHFYAGTHKEPLRIKVIKALNAGTPVFVSECSICNADGSGNADTASGNEWMDFIYKYNLSYIEWSLSNKAESSAILKPSCKKTSGYTDDDLTEIGKWYKDVMSTR